MPRRRTTARWTRSSKRASRPTTPAFARATGACTAASARCCRRNPVSALAVSAEEREAAFEQRWRIGGFALLGAFNDLLLNEQSNALAAEFVRGKIRAIVKDPQTARLLSPTHTIGCKRLCVDSGYYDTFNRPNVRLVDISRSADRALHRQRAAQRRTRLRVRRAGAGHRLRRDDRHVDAAGPARPRRPADPGQSGMPGR